MFVVETHCGDGINLAYYDRWFVSEAMGKYIVVASREYLDKYRQTLTFELGTYETYKNANDALKAINAAILSGEKGFRMPERF